MINVSILIVASLFYLPLFFALLGYQGDYKWLFMAAGYLISYLEVVFVKKAFGKTAIENLHKTFNSLETFNERLTSFAIKILLPFGILFGILISIIYKLMET